MLCLLEYKLVSARPRIVCREAAGEILEKKLQEGVFTAVVHIAALEQGSELDVLESALLLAKAHFVAGCHSTI